MTDIDDAVVAESIALRAARKNRDDALAALRASSSNGLVAETDAVATHEAYQQARKDAQAALTATLGGEDILEVFRAVHLEMITRVREAQIQKGFFPAIAEIRAATSDKHPGKEIDKKA